MTYWSYEYSLKYKLYIKFNIQSLNDFYWIDILYFNFILDENGEEKMSYIDWKIMIYF